MLGITTIRVCNFTFAHSKYHYHTQVVVLNGINTFFFHIQVMGPIMIAIDLTFLQGSYYYSFFWGFEIVYLSESDIEWIEGLQMIDLYVYLGFMGLVSIWSAYGFLTALMVSYNLYVL